MCAQQPGFLPFLLSSTCQFCMLCKCSGASMCPLEENMEERPPEEAFHWEPQERFLIFGCLSHQCNNLSSGRTSAVRRLDAKWSSCSTVSASLHYSTLTSVSTAARLPFNAIHKWSVCSVGLFPLCSALLDPADLRWHKADLKTVVTQFFIIFQSSVQLSSTCNVVKGLTWCCWTDHKHSSR